MKEGRRYPCSRVLWPRITRYLVSEYLRRDPPVDSAILITREDELLNLRLVENFEEWCEENGAINTNAGPEAFEYFIENTKDDEMKFVVRTLAKTFEIGSFIKRRELHAYHKLCRLLDTFLYLVARGNLVYDINWRCWFFSKPVCAPPTPETFRRILARIHVGRDLQFETLREFTGLELPKPPKEPTIQ